MRSAGAFDGGDARILLIAPDRCLAKRVSQQTTQLHVRVAEPDKFKMGKATIGPLDDEGSAERFDFIVHNNYLDTVSMATVDAVSALDTMLQPGGWHLFTLPIKGGTIEELDADSSEHERREAFGRHDRFRTFGRDDTKQLLQELWGSQSVLFPLARRYSEADLYRHGLDARQLSRVHSNAVFAWQARA